MPHKRKSGLGKSFPVITANIWNNLPVHIRKEPNYVRFSFHCPPNSTYSMCSDTCDDSCVGLIDPMDCPKVCAEGCECDEDLFFDGQQCVLMDRCGCYEHGRYYPTDLVFLTGDCSGSCTCSPSGDLLCEHHSCADDEKCTNEDGVMKCINTDPCKAKKCREKEECKLIDGKAQCIPQFTSSCWGWGDPHHHTLDGLDFDFQGTCTYTLMKYCGNDPTLVPFSIEAKNEIRGAINSVSYAAKVTIHMYGRTISMRRSDYPDIRVDDVRCSLPYFSPGGELQVVRSGLMALLTAECGLQVSFDWIWLYVVTVPSSYYGSTCGLCGNFNQNASDDTLDPNGNQVTDIVKWAGSWKVSDWDPLCWDYCPGNCPKCDQSKKSLYSSNQFCGLISNATGPFRDCHSTVKPHKFFDNCLYDVCMNGGAKTVLCQALGSYASTCLKNNARVDNWRTPSGCPLPCPVNSHYEACGNACPASCVDRTAPERCTAPCTETCQCDNGYVLSGSDCVAVANCGCSSGGMYYKPNEDFWADDNCGRCCTCDPSIGIVVCRTAKCKESERCTLVDGVRGCFPTSYATCSALRDSHYLTFDGKHFDFMGNCIYQLFGLTSDDPTHPSCRVTVKKNNRGNSAVLYTKDMTLEIYGMNISMTKDHPGKIQVDGVLTSLPFYSAGKTLTAFCSGDSVTIKTASEVTMRYYWDGRITVTMPSTYNNEVSGLCGNSNGDAEDDFTMKDGNLAPSAVEFGESWKVRDVPGCTSECTENCQNCSEEEDHKYKTAEYCGIINKPNGSFSQCYDTVDATTYFIDCVSDTCQKRGDPSIMCSAISAYVTACQEKGIEIQEWRTRQFCNPVCPESRHYELCGKGCADTCYGLAPPTGCDEKCKEGCFCNSGSILSGDQCVRIADCGCTHMDRYYPSGQDFYPDDSCQERCWCTGNGVADCVKTSCGANEECKVVKGVRGCHPSGYGTCAVMGASHYLSFDNRSFDFQGTCTYTLATICGGQSGRSFSVVVENQRLGSTHAAVTTLVSVSVHDQNIIMERGMQWTVKVNGERCNLPLTLSDGNVTINQEGIHKVLRTLDGMAVLYDSMNYLQVKVPSTSKEKMCGLCGNFNDDPSDDLQRPDGKTTENVDEFAASWKVAGKGPTCTDGCGSRCPDCGEEETAPFKTDTKCGMITAREGPFRNCHHLVSPTLFYSSCLYDTCAASGTQGALCSSLQAYVAACQDAGADIQAWREAASCPLSCPANSHYKINTYTCDFTCSALRGQTKWRDQSYEGCECDAGYAFDGDTCVPGNDCGCLYKGRYQKGNDSFVMPMCGERCFCGLDGNVVCALLTCGLDSTCGIRNGVIGCYRTHANCTISKGRDFISFDNKEGEMALPKGEMALPGAFDMAFVCDVNSKDWFRIVVDVQECSPGSVRTLVHVFFKNAFIAVNDKGDAWLIGRPLPTPVLVNGVITVFKSQEDLIIEEKGKVRLTIGPNGSVGVQAWDTFASLLCGACGNYNDNPDDDLRLSGGGSASDTTEMINSWKAPDFSVCV
ncbi:IgGFc-binding protein-like [Ambystoma mexicanum]|uniref:IgGFc-binding protein-like n=1 Tax=Ambystoma mexicanum TaxID=8296 RepID=UPI0037E861F7